MCALKAIVIIGCLVAAAVARPQVNWNDFFAQVPKQQQPQQGFFPQQPVLNPSNPFFPNMTSSAPSTAASDATTTARPATAVTTPSPQYLACLQSCPTTSEYNPVCGSDDQNYHNNGRLQCAQRCGQNVAAVRMGTCRPL